MKINDDELKALYQSAAGSERPASRDGCPPVEELVRTLRSQASKSEAAAVTDHVLHCGGCAREWGFLVEALRNEKELIRDLEKWQGADLKTNLPRPFFTRFSWALASLLAGLVIIGILVLRFLIPPSSDEYRAAAGAGVDILEPVGKGVSLSSMVFRWKPVPNREHYLVEVFDEALAPVWKGGPTFDNFAAPAEALRAKLVSGKSYFWHVTAVLPGGERLLSSLAEFVIR
jgi:hypothetical protein